MRLRNRVSEVVERARRRLALQVAVEDSSWGVVAALAGLTLLLVVGSQILRWYWIPLLLAVTAAVAWWRGRRRVPGRYRAAQRLDRALAARDLVSTAWHFTSNQDRVAAAGSVLEAVEKQASEAVRGAEVASLLPWRWPRAAVPALGLACLALILFGVRYGVLKSMDLRAPITEVRFDTLTGAALPAEAARRAGRNLDGPQPLGLQLPEGDKADVKDSRLSELPFESIQVESNEAGAAGRGTDGKEGKNGMQPDESEGAEENLSMPSPDESPTGAGDPRRQDGAKGQQRPPEKPNSLLDKMRDAFANLMQKLKIEPKGGDESQSASNKGNASQQGQKQRGDKGMRGQGKQQDADGSQQQSEQGEQSEPQIAKGKGEQAAEPPSKQEKSGAGSQDGSKETELAEHAEAMGKLTEILGKRAQNIQGEVMVEVNNSRNQQARTPYQNRSATHVEAGGEVSRDEVPLHLQPYVQKYYEQVRKQPPAPSARQ